ncbi:hypothetical protein PHISP_02945 [Aspergillus sp. HF37]|nr:hypothetical protein PHISP_02945 [Aspergillus sp. HF37]
METVNKVIDSASSALWRPSNTEQQAQHGDEPLAGIQGQGTATDPYDAGNRDDHQQQTPPSYTPSPLPPSGPADPNPANYYYPEAAPMVEESKPTRSDPSPGPGSGGPTDREEAKVVAAAQSSSGDEDYEAEPEVKVSEEALRGPKGPAPVPEYEFEKNIDANGEIKASHHEKADGGGGGARDHDHHSHGAHFPRSMSKLKDRFIGRAAKAGNHLHSTNR